MELILRRFAELFGGGQPQDRVRQQQLPKQGPTLDILGASSQCDFLAILILIFCCSDEAFTSENWIVGPFISLQFKRTDKFIKRSGFTKSRKRIHWAEILRVQMHSQKVKSASAPSPRPAERLLLCDYNQVRYLIWICTPIGSFSDITERTESRIDQRIVCQRGMFL